MILAEPDAPAMEKEKKEKSKSQLKREAKSLQMLAERLAALSVEQLTDIPLDDDLRTAINVVRTIHARGGRRRQLKYVAKLLRSRDDTPIRASLERIQGRQRHTVTRLHQAERWRERLLEEGDQALEALLEHHPHADRPRIRQLVRSANKERSAGTPSTSARALFRILRELMEERPVQDPRYDARRAAASATPAGSSRLPSALPSDNKRNSDA